MVSNNQMEGDLVGETSNLFINSLHIKLEISISRQIYL